VGVIKQYFETNYRRGVACRITSGKRIAMLFYRAGKVKEMNRKSGIAEK